MTREAHLRAPATHYHGGRRPPSPPFAPHILPSPLFRPRPPLSPPNPSLLLAATAAQPALPPPTKAGVCLCCCQAVEKAQGGA